MLKLKRKMELVEIKILIENELLNKNDLLSTF